MRCLSKSLADRPVSALELADLLAGSAAAGTWTSLDARNWWDDAEPSETFDPSATAPTVIAPVPTHHDSPRISTVSN
jgi:hypothetical protein